MQTASSRSFSTESAKSCRRARPLKAAIDRCLSSKSDNHTLGVDEKRMENFHSHRLRASHEHREQRPCVRPPATA